MNVVEDGMSTRIVKVRRHDAKIWLAITLIAARIVAESCDHAQLLDSEKGRLRVTDR